MRYLVLIFIVCACGGVTQKGAEPSSPPPPCIPIAQDDTHPISINWEAIKASNVPVPGTLEGTAVSQLNAGGLKGARFDMTFDPNALKSGIEERDSRIANFFFRVGQFSEATFKGTVDWIEGADNSLPAEGETRRITISGPLTISGQVVQVRVNALVRNEGGDITIENDGQNMIDVKATSLLQQNIVELLQAANVVSMERSVVIAGRMILERRCKTDR